ncbi:MAG TPA: VOC family protein [Methylomirabilota bacterium]
MSEEPRIDRLAQALEAMFADPGTPMPPADPELAELLRIAHDLRDLPDPAFKARLGADLLRRATMTTATGKITGRTIESVTAYLAVRPAVELVEFVKRAFGAQELLRTAGSSGGLHAEVQIGDSRLMIGGGEAWGGTPTPTGLHLYVPDADQVYQRAIEAGATSLHAPVDQPYGDREASVRDLAGNHWYIATHQSGGHIPPGLGSVTPYLHPRGADRLIDFLERAFAAEEMQIERTPDRAIKHAKIRVGRSVIEMGEAHGEWGPMPTMFYLHVDDVDAWYRRALAAGATSMEAPALQPYGDRRAAVRDAFANQWYLAEPATPRGDRQ